MAIKMSKIVREFLAEFIGTFILIFIGLASIAITRGTKGGNILLIAFSWGFALLSAITIAGPISGAHFNPGVSLALASLSKFPWNKLAHYIAAQYLGSFVAAAAVYGVYYQYLDSVSLTVYDDDRHIYRVFATLPHKSINMVTAMADSLLSCAFLMMVIMAVNDEKNNKIPESVRPFVVSLALVAIILAFCMNCGASLNPARDLGPKLLAGIVYGFKPIFNDLDYCWWWASQQIGLYLGLVIGGWIYYILFETSSSDKPNTKEDLKVQAVNEDIKP